MKKMLLAIFTLSMCNLSSAQNVFPSSGNTGIGTSTPGASLVVTGKTRILSGLTVGSDDDAPNFIPLMIKGLNGVSSTVAFTAVNNPVDQKVWALIASGDKFRLLTEADNYGSIREAMVFGRAGMDISYVAFPNGNVGIGTSDTKGYKFAVNGDAIFTKVKVKLSANWPDYVFKQDYQLPALAEVEKYIRQNRHLPGIPAAAEVEKEGLDVGANQAALLQKIEELTLYVIEQNKKIAQLEARINEAHSQNTSPRKSK